MNVWDKYQSVSVARGMSRREASIIRESRMLESKIINSLSFHKVNIDGVPREVSIDNSDNLNEKIIRSLPGEDLDCGGLVEWADNFWLIVEKDANNEIYTKAKLLQCNYLLRWVDKDHYIHEQWCVIEDGTKYLTGEFEDRNFIVTRGDSRIAMTIAKNQYTSKLNRDNRFIIDDPDSENKLAYQLTKPLKVGKTYGGMGIYSFVLQEVVTTEDDNLEISIADYYTHFPRNTESLYDMDSTSDSNGEIIRDGRKVWI